MYQTQWTYEGPTGEKFIQPSQTIQGEAFTIRELMQKFSTGQNPTVSHTPVYSNSDDFDDIDQEKVGRLDIQDKNILAEQNKQRIAAQKNLLDQQIQAAKQKQQLQKSSDDSSDDDVTKGGKEGS